MINKIHFNSYKSLQNISINLSNGINIIAGNNGTCKSSILHVISNSYKKTSRNSDLLLDNKCINIITKLNKYTVPKIEALNRGSMANNDPTNGHKGTIYEVYFENGTTQSFRKHNVTSTALKSPNRYSVKPYYGKGKSEKLTESMNVYLSLDRLYPYGEFQDDDALSKLSANLPNKYLDLITEAFKEFTSIDISYSTAEQMGSIKNRWKFSSNVDNIDSNTISSGEDNLLIILIATYSLVYYCDCLKDKNNDVYLLIDEFDASLHPEFQVRYLNYFAKLSESYPNFSLVATTHSLTTIEESIKNSYNLIYLIKRPSGVKLMDTPDLKKIKANLLNSLHRDLFNTVSIPILTEDAEARLLLNVLFDKFGNNTELDFSKVRNYFNPIDASFSSETLKTLCSAQTIPKNNFPAIAILDGDQIGSMNRYTIRNCIITLPGNKSPERMIYDICLYLKGNKSTEADLFWNTVENELGFTHDYMTRNIIPQFEQLDKKIEDLKAENLSIKGIYRDESKKIFNQNVAIYKKLFEFWISLDINQKEIKRFYDNLKVCYYKICDYYSLATDLWHK